MTLLAMLRKETLLLLRAPLAVVLLFVYLAILALVVLGSWPTDNVLTLAARASQRLSYLIGVGQVLMLLSILPGLTANSVVRERESGCLELLQASRLEPIVILLGKWLGGAVYAWILLICSLPLIVLCHILGTLDWRLVGAIYCHLGLTAMWAGVVGLATGSVARTGYGALMSAYGLVSGFSVLTVAPSFLSSGSWPAVLRSVSPIGSMVTLIEPNVWEVITGAGQLVPNLAWYATSCLSSSTVLAGVAWLRLREPFHVRARRVERVIDARSDVLRRKLRFPFYLIDPQRRRRHIGDWINPVLARELRSRMLGQGTNFIRVFYAVLIFSFLVTIDAVFRTAAEIVDSVRVVVIASQVILIGLLAPPLSAPAVSRERERNTLDVLRLTRLGPWRLVAGNLYFVILVSLCILVAALPMWITLFGLQRIPPHLLARAIAVILASLACGTLAGLFASSLVARTGPATGIAYVLVLLILFGTLLPILLGGTLSPALQADLLSLNPIVAAVHCVSLGLFRNVLDATAWQRALAFLIGLWALMLFGAVYQTRRLFRSR